jgi:hypothetical protein
MKSVAQGHSAVAALAGLVAALVLSSAAGAVPRPKFVVKTLSPLAGQVVKKKVKWEVSVVGGRPNRVEFAIDGVLKWTDLRAPYAFKGDRGYLDSATLAPGRHTLRATAFEGSGDSRKRNSLVSIVVQPPASGIYWGAYMEGKATYGSGYEAAPWDDNTWELFESHAGKRVSIVHWGTSLPPWQREFNVFLSTFRKVLARGDLSLVDMSSATVPLRDIAAGKYDGALTTWVRQAKAWGHPFFLRWDAEMNGSWNAWGTTPSNFNSAVDYVNAWQHFHDIATKVGATNISWVWCPNIDPFKTKTPYTQLYPGDAYVDWTCLDGYNFGGTDWMTFSQLFRPSYQEVLRLAPGKPIMIAEIGSAENGGSKAGWITDALAQLPSNFPRIQALVWFNVRIYQNGSWWSWQIESSGSAQTAFANGIARPHYRPGGGFGKLPILSKIAPPS